MSDLTKLVLGIVSALVVAAVVAVWKLISGKADKDYVKELDRTNNEGLAKAIESFDKDIKALNLRVDNFIVQIGQSVTKADLIKDLNVATVRADDRDVRVQRDITELKNDVKATVEKLTQVDKKLDDLPTRVAGLEQTRKTNDKQFS